MKMTADKIIEFLKYIKIPKMIKPALLPLAIGATALGFNALNYEPKSNVQENLPTRILKQENLLPLGERGNGAAQEQADPAQQQINALEEQIRVLVDQDTPDLNYSQRINTQLEIFNKYSQLLNLEGNTDADVEELSSIVLSLDNLLTEWSNNATIEDSDAFYDAYRRVTETTGVDNEYARKTAFLLSQAKVHTAIFNKQLLTDDWNGARKTAQKISELTGNELQVYLDKVLADTRISVSQKKFATWQKAKNSTEYVERQNAQTELDKSFDLLEEAYRLDQSRVNELEQLWSSFAAAEDEFKYEKFSRKLTDLSEQLSVNVWGEQVDLREQATNLWNELLSSKRQISFDTYMRLVDVAVQLDFDMHRRAFQLEADKAEEQLYDLRFQSVAMHDLLSAVSQEEGKSLYDDAVEGLVQKNVLRKEYTNEELTDLVTKNPGLFLNEMAELNSNPENTFVAQAIQNWKRHSEYIQAYAEGRTSLVEQNLDWTRNVHEYIANVADLIDVVNHQQERRQKIVEQFGEFTAQALDRGQSGDQYDPLQQSYVSGRDWLRVLRGKVESFQDSNKPGTLQREVYDQVLNGRFVAQAAADFKASQAQREADDGVRARQAEQRFFYELFGPVRAVNRVAKGLTSGIVEFFECCPCDLFREIVEAVQETPQDINDILGVARVGKGLAFHPLELATKDAPYLGALVQDINDSTPLQDPLSGRANSYAAHLQWQGPNKGYFDVYKREVEEFGQERAALRFLYRAAVDGYTLNQIYEAVKPKDHTNNQTTTNQPQPQPTPTPTPDPTPVPVPTPDPTPVPVPSSPSGGLGGGDIIGNGIKTN